MESWSVGSAIASQSSEPPSRNATGSKNRSTQVRASSNLSAADSGGVMCSGPYELKQWSPGNQIVLQANPDYWDPAYKPKIKTISVKFIVNASTLRVSLVST